MIFKQVIIPGITFFIIFSLIFHFIYKNKIKMTIKHSIITTILFLILFNSIGYFFNTSKNLKIAILLGTGGLGDGNFNDKAFEAISEASQDFDFEFTYIEPYANTYTLEDETSLLAESEEYDLIIAMGYDYNEPVEKISKLYPKQKFTIFDTNTEIENVRTVYTYWSEQTFLSGVLAALEANSTLPFANDKNTIGIIIGKDFDNMLEGVAGFMAGAKYVNKDITVLSDAIGSFNDANVAYSISTQMHNQGATFIQHISGLAGDGLFESAKDNKFYAIGVGTNQNDISPDYIAFSSIRSVKEVIYNEIELFINGQWESEVHGTGIKENSDLGYTIENSNVPISIESINIVEDIKQKIINDELVIPNKIEDVEDWSSKNYYFD